MDVEEFDLVILSGSTSSTIAARTIASARYAGALLSKRTPIPGKDARLAETSFGIWIKQAERKRGSRPLMDLQKEPVGL